MLAKCVCLSLLAVLIACFGVILLLSIKSFPGHGKLKRALLDRLVIVNAMKNGSSLGNTKPGTILYVLGGTQISLVYKFKLAADLYHRGVCEKIIFMSEPGITEYDPQLNRNLTNDEWAIRWLVDLKVPQKNIEVVAMKRGFFGTLSEARGMRALASKRNYTHIILVTSSFHTRRTLTTFSRVFQDRGLTLSIYGVAEPIGLRGELYEYMKLFLYERIVLPFYDDRQSEEGHLSVPTEMRLFA